MNLQDARCNDKNKKIHAVMFSKSATPAPGPNWGYLPKVKWPGREVSYSPISSAENENMWKFTSPPPPQFYAFTTGTGTTLPLPLPFYGHVH